MNTDVEFEAEQMVLKHETDIKYEVFFKLEPDVKEEMLECEPDVKQEMLDVSCSDDHVGLSEESIVTQGSTVSVSSHPSHTNIAGKVQDIAQHINPSHSTFETQNSFISGLIDDGINTQRGQSLEKPSSEEYQMPLECEKCGFCTNQNCFLVSHMSVYHPDTPMEKPFGCLKCGRKFKRKGTLKTHINSLHSNEGPYSCSQCNYKAKTKYAITLHTRYGHSDDRPYSCSQCQFRSNNKYDVIKHMKNIHKQIKPGFNCHLCSEIFWTECCLNLHMNATMNGHGMNEHIIMQNYAKLKESLKCEKCPGFECKIVSILSYHMRHVHNEEAPCCCKQCLNNNS